jgi:hypothetical protein
MRRLLGIGIGVVLAATACVAPDAPAASHVEAFDLPGYTGNRDLDVLFVVDNSPAMAPYRASLMSSAASFINVMNTVTGGLPNVHIGVVTAALADLGKMHAPPSVTGVFVSDQLTADGVTRVVNYSGSLADSLSMMFDVGTSRSGASQPFEAMHLALDNNLTNTGFLRARAALAVVLVTARDDASPASVESYATAVMALKTDPTTVMMAGIFLRPAARLDGMLNSFPNRNTFVSIDQPDYGQALALFPQFIKDDVYLPCIVHPLDLEPDVPGGQYDCSVSAIGVGPSGEVTETLVRPCFRQSEGCWFIGEGVCPAGLAAMELLVHPRNRPRLKGQCVVP